MTTFTFRARSWGLVITSVMVIGTGCASSSAASGGGADLGVVDTRIGTGARATLHQCLYVHYVGALPDGQTFETSRAPAAAAAAPEPIAFELGTGAVMQGWEKGLVNMLLGGTRRLFVPYRMAYGAGGRPPSIPARTDLIFDIDLLAVAAPLPTSSNAARAETARTCPAWSSVSRTR
jgi:hypothetical protein